MLKSRSSNAVTTAHGDDNANARCSKCGTQTHEIIKKGTIRKKTVGYKPLTIPGKVKDGHCIPCHHRRMREAAASRKAKQNEAHLTAQLSNEARLRKLNEPLSELPLFPDPSSYYENKKEDGHSVLFDDQSRVSGFTAVWNGTKNEGKKKTVAEPVPERASTSYEDTSESSGADESSNEESEIEPPTPLGQVDRFREFFEEKARAASNAFDTPPRKEEKEKEEEEEPPSPTDLIEGAGVEFPDLFGEDTAPKDSPQRAAAKAASARNEKKAASPKAASPKAAVSPRAVKSPPRTAVSPCDDNEEKPSAAAAAASSPKSVRDLEAAAPSTPKPKEGILKNKAKFTPPPSPSKASNQVGFDQVYKRTDENDDDGCATPPPPVFEISMTNSPNEEDDEPLDPNTTDIHRLIHGLGTVNDDARYARKFLVSLRTMSIHYQNRVGIAEAGGIPAIVKCMDRFGTDSSVAKQGCAALQNLGCTDDNEHLCVEQGGVDAIVRAMNFHPKSPGTQEHGCAALRNLTAGSAANRTAVVEAGGTRAVVEAMGNHPCVPGVQEKACAALGNLCIKHSVNRAEIGKAGGVKAVITALGTHGFDQVGVAEKGLRALLNLSYSYSNVEMMKWEAGIEGLVLTVGQHHGGRCKEWALRIFLKM